MKIRDLQDESYAIANKKGFWTDLHELTLALTNHRLADAVVRLVVNEKLALITSELSEALDEVRNGLPLSSIRRRESDGKPEGFPVELADAVIRIADLAGHFGIDLEAAIDMKQEYNRSRPYKHGRTC